MNSCHMAVSLDPPQRTIFMHSRNLVQTVVAFMFALFIAAPAMAQMERTTDRRPDEGSGPHERLIIRGATIIDGTGAPPQGPVDIVIEGDRITSVRSVGYPGVPINPARRPDGATFEIDASGMYVLPGFVD